MVSERRVRLLRALAPDRDGDAGRGVVGEDDLALDELLAVLGGEGQHGLEARNDPAQVGREGGDPRLDRAQVRQLEDMLPDLGHFLDLLDLRALVESDLVAVVARVELFVGDAQAAARECEALALLKLVVEFGHGVVEEARADLTTLGIQQIDREHLPFAVAERPRLRLRRDPGADGPLGIVGRQLADGEERALHGCHPSDFGGYGRERCTSTGTAKRCS
mmetsp:Transcript_2067/g.5494  ORF Transcript_2067/g.5494 Transcript_2067/m.5494 type:complete len:220 (+) Transcript_2067:981-1640(+)